MVSLSCLFTASVFARLLAVHAGIKALALDEIRWLTLMPFSDQMCNEMRCCDGIDLHPWHHVCGL